MLTFEQLGWLLAHIAGTIVGTIAIEDFQNGKLIVTPTIDGTTLTFLTADTRILYFIFYILYILYFIFYIFYIFYILYFILESQLSPHH